MTINNELEYKDYIKNLYGEKILGSDLYASGRDYKVEDFTDLNILLDFFEQTDTSESYLTPAGKAFIKYYWGWDILAEILLVNQAHQHMFLGKELDEAKPHWQNVQTVSNFLKAWPLSDNKNAVNLGAFMEPKVELDSSTIPPGEHDDNAQLDY